MSDIRNLYDNDVLDSLKHISRRNNPTSLKIGNDNVQYLHHNRANVINENIMVIAPPKQGKTTLIKSMLLSIKSLMPTVLLIAPTNTLGENFMPRFLWICAKEKGLGKTLLRIQTHQIELRSYHDSGNDFQVLTTIANKLKLGEGAAGKKIKELNERIAKTGKRARYIDDLITVLKFYISKKTHCDRERALSARELKITMNMNREPYMVMIFDDMGMNLKNLSEYNSICTNYRHMSITLITLIHHGNMLHTVARNCASYKITRHNSDMIWLIENTKGSTNEYTENFIYKHGESVTQYTSKNRFFLVLSNNHKHVKLQVLFTAVEYESGMS